MDWLVDLYRWVISQGHIISLVGACMAAVGFYLTRGDTHSETPWPSRNARRILLLGTIMAAAGAFMTDRHAQNEALQLRDELLARVGMAF